MQLLRQKKIKKCKILEINKKHTKNTKIRRIINISGNIKSITNKRC